MSIAALNLTPQKRRDSIAAYADNAINLINDRRYIGIAGQGESALEGGVREILFLGTPILPTTF